MPTETAETIELTDEQIEIVQAPTGARSLVIAGPGTGKTEVVARRLAFLLRHEGLRPADLLVLSFSRAAVKALISRIRSLEDAGQSVVEDLRYLSVRTFDSWAFRVLRFLGREPKDLLQQSYDDNINELRELIATDGVEAIDAMSPLRLKGIRHIVVDEFQDLSGSRAGLVQSLLQSLVPADTTSGHCGFTALGDPGQEIFGWTAREQEIGVSITSSELMDWIRTSYGSSLRQVSLSLNHRSEDKIAQLVTDAASVVNDARESGQDPRPALKTLIDSRVEHESLDTVLSEVLDSANGSKVAILCRDNSQVLTTALQIQKHFPNDPPIPVTIMMASSPPKPLPCWIAAMLYKLLSSTLTHTQFKKIYEYVASHSIVEPPCEGDPEAAWQLLLRFAKLGETEASISMERFRERILWPDSLPDDEGETQPQLVISTIHQSKGLEFDSVKLLLADRKQFKGSELEEGRIVVVGLSRPRKTLSVLDTPEETEHFRSVESRDRTRTRWHRWFKLRDGTLHQMELGLECDLDPESFVHSALHGGQNSVDSLQKYLLDNQQELIGRDLILSKQNLPGDKLRFVYNVCLATDGTPGQVLGQTTDRLTWDILNVRHHKQGLPTNIYNLRIQTVSSLVGSPPLGATVPDPWRTSGLWLGVVIHGVGQFKTYWKSRK